MDEVFDGDVHAKRVQSVAGAVIGVLAAGSLAVAAIGQGLAHVCGLDPKHAKSPLGSCARKGEPNLH